MLISEKYKQDFCTGVIDTIPDSWFDIIRHTGDGTYRDRYHIGDTKVLHIKNHLPLCMQIAAFDADDLSDGSGKAAITWIAEDLFDARHRMNPVLVRTSEGYVCGTGSICGWEHSEMRAYLRDEIMPLLPEVVRDNIKAVRKFSKTFDVNGQAETITTYDFLWVPSYREVFGGDGIEHVGACYSQLFDSRISCRKSYPGSSSANRWWLRSASSTYVFYNVSGDGNANGYGASNSFGVALSFCT